MSELLRLRDIRSGSAAVCDRSTGWPLARVTRRSSRFTFPGIGRTTANVWTVTVGDREISVDRTRAGAVALAAPKLHRLGLLRSVER